MRQLLRRSAIALLVLSAAILLHSQIALASATGGTLNTCDGTCPQGSCHAETVWFVFWADCSCGCTAEGYPTCTCT
jgi:hypothetical protein